jgi:phytoene dehydrogenase-like protein
MKTATIVGSGPNGLSAAIVLASAGLATVVVERNPQIGGACSSAEVTLPGYKHDLGSSVSAVLEEPQKIGGARNIWLPHIHRSS